MPWRDPIGVESPATAGESVPCRQYRDSNLNNQVPCLIVCGVVIKNLARRLKLLSGGGFEVILSGERAEVISMYRKKFLSNESSKFYRFSR